MPLFVTIVLDGVGIGEQPDAALYGDSGTHTLGHVCDVARPHLPNLEKFGLGCITPLAGIEAVVDPVASFGKMLEVSAGKDSTTGHWELGGIRLTEPFPTFPNGFPEEMITKFTQLTGYGGVLGNCAASGTDIIASHGESHQQSGWPIVYTSADSVFQVAAHQDVIALNELYRICAIARDEVCTGNYGVGRVIARPFTGTPGAYERISSRRKDYSLLPPSQPVQAALQAKGVQTISIGKIADLFGGAGFDECHKTRSNKEGIKKTLEAIKNARHDEHVFVWVNLVDFDQEYGHRNNPVGFAGALEEFDEHLPALHENLPDDGVMIITADHGNDPTTPGTDHSREYVPVLKYIKGVRGQPLGVRKTFADHAATVAAFFDVQFDCEGKKI